LAKYGVALNVNASRAGAIAPRFDVARAIEPYFDSAFQPTPGEEGALRLGLRVTGHGGGDWNLWLTGEGILGADLGLHPQCTATLECDVDVLADLASGRATFAELLPGQLPGSGGADGTGVASRGRGWRPFGRRKSGRGEAVAAADADAQLSRNASSRYGWPMLAGPVDFEIFPLVIAARLGRLTGGPVCPLIRGDAAGQRSFGR